MSQAKDSVPPAERARELVSDAVDRTKDAMNQHIEGARERLHEVADDARQRLRHAREGVRKGAAHAREVAREKYEVASDHLREGYSRVQKNVDHLVDDVGEYVRDNPGKSILMAAGAGFLLGLLLRRRH